MNTVTRMPSTLTTAAIDSAASSPPALKRIGKDADEASELARCRRDAMAGRPTFHRKELGRVDEGRRVRPEFGEEIADAVDDQEGIDEFLDARNRRDGGETH